MKTEMQTPMSAFSVTAYGNGKMDSGSSKGVVERDPAKALIESLASRLAVLEARPMMPGPGSGDDGDVATLDGSVVVWEKAASGFPDLADVDDGTIFYVSGETVEMLAPPTKAAVLCFDPDTEEPYWVEAGEDGTVLQVSDGDLVFGTPTIKWS